MVLDSQVLDRRRCGRRAGAWTADDRRDPTLHFQRKSPTKIPTPTEPIRTIAEVSALERPPPVCTSSSWAQASPRSSQTGTAAKGSARPNLPSGNRTPMCLASGTDSTARGLKTNGRSSAYRQNCHHRIVWGGASAAWSWSRRTMSVSWPTEPNRPVPFGGPRLPRPSCLEASAARS